jgi:hypothetical protein
MQKLLERQLAETKLREALEKGVAEPTIEERVAHVSHLQHVQHERIFVVGYSTIYKAASENDVLGIKFFLENKTRKKDKMVFPETFDKAGV